MPRRLYGRCAFLKQIPDLLTQFRAVLVTVNLHRVLNRNFEQFLVRVGRKRHRAIHFAGIFATVDEFPSHSILLGHMPLSRHFSDSRRFRRMLPRFRAPDKQLSIPRCPRCVKLKPGANMAFVVGAAAQSHQADLRRDVRHGRRI